MDKNQKDQNKIALDVLSGVDEEVLDKATTRRFTLLTQLARRRRRKKIVFSSASLAACLAIIFCAVFLIPLFTKQVPVYTGMTVSNTSPAAQNSAAIPAAAEGDTTLLALPSYHPFGASHSLKTDNPNANPNGQITSAPAEGEIAEKIESSLSVTGAATELYYAKPQQDIYITVHVDNPDSFEILSFTLNGNKYSSYMFETGSDMENLILKVNVGDTEGILEYTIDAIKYVDGTEIKDVRMDGERTVKVGVATENQPKTQVSEPVVGISILSFETTVTDELKLVEHSKGMLWIVLTDGETVVAQENLTVGETRAMSFEGLSPDHAYTYGIYAYYDALDGTGMNLYELYEQEIVTQKAVWFKDGQTTQTALAFSLDWNEASATKALQSLALYCENTLVRELATDTTSVDGLLSGISYRLVATYRYGDRIETAEYSFTTEAKVAPAYELSTGAVTQSSIGFGIAETDIDNIGEITKIELIHATEETRVAPSTDIRSFEGLRSGNEYTLKITYVYDLNDGNGVHTETVEKKIKTAGKAAPIYVINSLTATQTKVDFDITETDVDNIGTITKIELLHATEETRVAASNTVRSFDGLLSGNEYTLKITYAYDLNDGNGVQEKIVEKLITTQVKTAPTYAIVDLTATQTKVDFDITETDVDEIGTITKIELLHATETDRNGNGETRSFDGLSSANAYTIRITYTYDLNDGTGLHTKTVTKDFATLAREITVTDLEFTGKTTLAEGESTSLKITLNNPDNVPFTNFVINGANVTPIKAEYYGPNVYIVQDLTLSAGQVLQLQIERIDYTVSVHTLSQSTDFQDDEEIAWIGSISLKDASAMGGKKYYNSDETVTVIYYFEGLEDYTVFSINSRPATKIDDSTYSVSYGTRTGTGGMFTYYQSEITYGISNKFQMQTSVSIDQMTATEPYSVWWFGPDVIDISTPQQLQNMTNNKTYRLVNDIDLSGVNWVPYEFEGVLYGGGYEIKNLTLTEKHAYLDPLGSSNGNSIVSMFKASQSGYNSPSLIDVKFTGVNVTITAKSGDKPIYVYLLVQNEMGYYPSQYCSVEGTITYVDYANQGANIWCIGYESGFFDCSFAGTISYFGNSELRYHLCGDYHAYCENGAHSDNIPCPSASNTTVYINGVKQ